MFEKEVTTTFKKKATKIAEKKVKEFYKECGWEDYKYMIPEFADVGIKCMQKGAEFAYNKANEWHNVADGDLPKDNNKIVLCICGNGFINGKINYVYRLLTRREFSLFAPVYRWKEIVPPEEKDYD